MIWDASDANPMHRRIPAEVVSRRRVEKKPKPVEATDEVTVDLKTAITLKPEARPKWLSKACAMVSQNKASSTELFDIVINRKFSGGLPDKVGRRIASILQESLSLFSDKQRRSLTSSDSPLMAQFAAVDDEEASPSKVASKSVDAPDKPNETKTTTKVQIQPSWSAPPARVEGSSWQVADDEATVRRLKAQEASEREAQKKNSKDNQQELQEKTRRKKEEEEAEKRRKLEEEADSIFARAMVPAVVEPQVSKRGDDRGRSVSAARSDRSISSRTARRQMREAAKKPSRGPWNSSGPSSGALSGSRAILLNPDYVEDLPHLPRNSSSAQTTTTRFERSRSRSRRRRRDR